MHLLLVSNAPIRGAGQKMAKWECVVLPYKWLTALNRLTSEVGNGFCREMLLPCPAPIRWIPLRDWQHQAPFHNSALVKVHIVKLEEIGRMWVACSPCCKINLASYPEIRAGVFSWVNLLHWFWLEQRPFCASAVPAWGGVSQERLLTAYKCVVSSWGATEGMVGFRVLVQSSADTSSTLLPPTWFLWVFMSAVSCLSLTSSAFIKDLTVAWFVLCSEMFWGLPRVCLPLCDP